MPKCAGIYSFRNSYNGKRYIGQSIDINYRKNRHLRLLRQGLHPNAHFQASFAQYGEEAFEFEVLEMVELGMMDVREQAWITYYRSNEKTHGYNMLGGSAGCRSHSDETKAKIGAANKGKVISQGHREAIRAFHIGRNHSQETRAKMSLSKKGRKLSEGHKKKIALARLGKKYPRGGKS